MIKRPTPARHNIVFGSLLAVSLVTSCTAIGLYLMSNRSTIVYVAQKLVNGYNGMHDARKEFEIKSKVWQENLDTLKIEFEEKVKEYELTSSKLSLKEKLLLEELIAAKNEQYLNYQQVISEKVKHEDEQLSNKVLARVNDYVKRYGEERGYSIIMAATQFGNIVYAEKQKDITEDVLSGLNSEYSN